MESTISTSIRCDDGTEIPFEWAYADAPAYEWMRDRSHWPQPATPMERWTSDKGWPGADRAWDEINMVPPPMFYRFQLVGPFMYARMTMNSPERMAEIVPRYIEVSKEYGGALAFWLRYCEPRIARSCGELAAMGPGADLAAAAELAQYGFHQTFTSLTSLGIASLRLGAMLTAAGVENPELTALEVTQGGDNATQAIDGEIWELAELARATPAVARVLASENEDHLQTLRGEPAAREFLEAFDALIARHGRRSQGWALTDETWEECPEAALALVRAQVQAERVSPEDMRARSERRRTEATERVLGALPAEKHDEFRSILKLLDGYVAIREGRAYWQMTVAGQLRALLLRCGADLVRNGRIEKAEDILFLTPDDFTRDATSDLRGRVAEARAERERWLRVVPPFIIGTPGDTFADAEQKRKELRGSPASRGVVVGRARILQSPEEGSRLQPGDILVCVMTTPSWTPLFAIAGGIVTETGGALSHPAITAREYGIPAVVALREATTRFRDGQMIRVDGGAGTVSAVEGLDVN